MDSKTTAQKKDAVGTPISWPTTAAKLFIGTVVGLLLYVAHEAFVPVALALLLSLILSGPVEALHKRHVPRALSAVVIFVCVISIFGAVVGAMWTPAQGWYANAPQTLKSVQRKVKPVAQFMDRFDALRKNASNISGSTDSPPPPPPAVAAPSAPGLIIDATGSAIAGVLTFVIVTIFLLTGGPPMLARMTAAFADNLNVTYVLHIIEKVREEVGHFYAATTFINIGLGVATGLAMWAWGMPTPYLWGALAAIVNYVPYAGSLTTLLVITLVAIVSFDTLGHVLGVSGTYVLFATIEGQVAQPLLVGRRLEVNPLLIFLALWFGGLFWGIAGIILATPLLVTLKVVAENAKTGKPMMEFLGPNDQTQDRDKTLYRLAGRTR